MLSRVLALCALLLFADGARSAAPCFHLVWSYNGINACASSTCGTDALSDNPLGSGTTVGDPGSCAAAPTSGGQTCTGQLTKSADFHHDGNIVTVTSSYSAIAIGVPCPPNTCGANAGKTFIVSSALNGQPIHGEMAGGDGCAYTSSDGGFHYIMGGGATLQTAVGAGTLAAAGDPTASIGPGSGDGTNLNACVTSLQGTFCLSQGGDGKNCGTVNGDAVCLGSVPNNSCVSYASGAVACTVAAVGASAATPPSPNSGTPGVAATPTASVAADNGLVTNYYSSSVVKASTTPVITSGNPSSASGTGTGTGSAGTAPNTAPVSKDCAFLGNCDPGSVPTLPEVSSVQASTSSYMSAIQGAPIVQAFSNISASIPSGTCPAPQFEIWGHTFTMDAACTIFNQVSSVLSAICMVVYVIMGARILMSA